MNADYPNRAWERGRETSKLDMSFFPITDRARGPPPPSRRTAAAAPTATPNSPHNNNNNNADLLGIDFDSSGEVDEADTEEAAGDGGGLGGGTVTAGVGEGVVFEGLALPGVVHEETRPVDTENASVEASVKVGGRVGRWRWTLTLSFSCGRLLSVSRRGGL